MRKSCRVTLGCIESESFFSKEYIFIRWLECLEVSGPLVLTVAYKWQTYEMDF